jgi:hypothetical protein
MAPAFVFAYSILHFECDTLPARSGIVTSLVNVAVLTVSLDHKIWNNSLKKAVKIPLDWNQ